MFTDATKLLRIKKLAVLLLGLLVIAGICILSGCFSGSSQALNQAHAALQGTGSIEAKSISASFKVPGKLNSILVNVGDPVSTGQEIASVESGEIEAKVAQAQGAYSAALGQQNQAQDAIGLASDTVNAKIQQAQAGIAQAQAGKAQAIAGKEQAVAGRDQAVAGLEQAKIAMSNAEATYNRVKELYTNGFAAESDYDDARDNFEAKKAQVTQIEAQVTQLEAQVTQLDAQIAQMDAQIQQVNGQLAEALAARQQVAVYEAQYQAAAGQSQMASGAVQEAEVYLANTHLYSPINGYITSKIMEAGEMVNAGTPVLEITDVEHTCVKVFIDEVKIGRVQLGQKATITVPAYPDREFSGTVTQISSAGQFAVQKAINEQYSHDLQSFEVRIDVDNADLALKVGMTATVKLDEDGGQGM